MFNRSSGVALLVASGNAGLLWDQVSPATTFWAGAGISLAGVVACISVRSEPVRSG